MASRCSSGHIACPQEHEIRRAVRCFPSVFGQGRTSEKVVGTKTEGTSSWAQKLFCAEPWSPR